MKNDKDEIFWLRLAEMPDIEAEQECFSRKESLLMENAVLQAEILKIKTRKGIKTNESFALGVAISENNEQITRLNRHIRCIRMIDTNARWKESIRAICGQEALDDCLVWQQHQYGHIDKMRNELET